MTWITRTEISVPQRVSNWQVLPDHYPDRLKGSGTYTFKDGSDGPDSSVVTLAGELKVRVPLVGGTVERVIVNGLKSYFSAEVQGLPEVAPG